MQFVNLKFYVSPIFLETSSRTSRDISRWRSKRGLNVREIGGYCHSCPFIVFKHDDSCSWHNLFSFLEHFLSTSDAIIPRRKLKKPAIPLRNVTHHQNTVLNQCSDSLNAKTGWDDNPEKYILLKINYFNNLFNYGHFMWWTLHFRCRSPRLLRRDFLETIKLGKSWPRLSRNR